MPLTVREAKHGFVWQRSQANDQWKAAFLGDFSGTNVRRLIAPRERSGMYALVSTFSDFLCLVDAGVGTAIGSIPRSHLEHNSGSSRHPVRVYFDIQLYILV